MINFFRAYGDKGSDKRLCRLEARRIASEAKTILDRDPAATGALVQLSWAALQNTDDNWDNAIGYAQQAIDIDSSCWHAHGQLGLALLDKAVNNFRAPVDRALIESSLVKALNADGYLDYYHYGLGHVELMRGNCSGALRRFRVAWSYRPSYSRARAAIAGTYWFQHKYLDFWRNQFPVNIVYHGSSPVR